MLAIVGRATSVLAQAKNANDTLRYVTIHGGRANARTTVWTAGPRSFNLSSVLHDRGRGDSAEVSGTFDGDGQIISMRSAGHTIWQLPSSSEWTRTGNLAHLFDSGLPDPTHSKSIPVNGPAFYIDWPYWPVAYPAMVNWTLAHPGRTVRAMKFNSDTAQIVEVLKVTTMKVKSRGRSSRLTLVAVKLGGALDDMIWLDDRGRFAASGTRLIRDDLLPYAARFAVIEDSLLAPGDARLARTLALRPDSGIAIIHATLIDVRQGVSRPGTTVLIRGRRIVAVVPDTEAVITAGVHVIDAGGKSLSPGLWDMHQHITGPTDEGRRGNRLGRGITSMRDLDEQAPRQFEILEHIRRLDSGRETGPRLVNAGGFIDGEGPFTAPTWVAVRTLSEALRWVDIYADSGYEQIKLYSSLPVEFVKPIALRAHSRGLRLSGHVPSFMTAEQAVRSGYDEINHINMVALNFVGVDTIDTRGMGRFTALSAIADVNPDGDAFHRFTDLLLERNVSVDPTLCVFENLMTGRSAMPIAKSDSARYQRAFDVLGGMVKRLDSAGVRILGGTDNGCVLSHELELYASAGISNGRVLRIATLGAAEYTHREKDLGTIEQGKLADMVLWENNPLTDLKGLRRPVIVIKDGALYDPKALRESEIPWP